MKKLLLALPFLTLPLTSMAQDKPAVMPRDAVNAAIKQFKPSFCSDDIATKAELLNQCYIKVAFDPTDPEYQKCLLADMFLTGRIDTERTISKEKGEPDPYPNLPSFLTRDSTAERVKRFFNILDTKGYSPAEKKAYLLGPVKEFRNFMTHFCD